MAQNIYITMLMEKTEMISENFTIVTRSLPHKAGKFWYKNLTQ